jgi:hypothetical protein
LTPLEQDQLTARAKLPNSRYVEVDGTQGWFYTFNSELGDEYTMYVYRSHSTGLYMVKMVFPEMDSGQGSNPHTEHLFSDGNVCLAREVGLPTLELAYSKSVLFANAWSFFRRGHGFPFKTE